MLVSCTKDQIFVPQTQQKPTRRLSHCPCEIFASVLALSGATSMASAHLRNCACRTVSKCARPRDEQTSAPRCATPNLLSPTMPPTRRGRGRHAHQARFAAATPHRPLRWRRARGRRQSGKLPRSARREPALSEVSLHRDAPSFAHASKQGWLRARAADEPQRRHCAALQ